MAQTLDKQLNSKIESDIDQTSDSFELSKKDVLLEENLFKTAKDFDLNKREMQILTLIIAARTNQQIAKLLCLNRRMIEYHRQSLMVKLKAESVSDLVKRAVTMGII
jgi:DNA-binding CsgD family transcriptional regulator